MRKTLRAILAEQDSEFVYHIKSTRHLHDDEIFYQIQIGLLGYDLRSLERVSYNPLAAVEPMFNPKNDAPGIDYVYHVRAVLGSDVANGILRQKIAQFTNIHWKYLVVHRDGESLEQSVDVEPEQDGGSYLNLAHHARDWDGTPDEGTIDPSAQDYVGHKRLDNFVKELQADRADREKEIAVRNVDPQLVESFVTSHTALKSLGQQRLAGFYLVERNHNNVLKISGPFKKQPVNYEFVPELINESVVYEMNDVNELEMKGHSAGDVSNFRYTKSTVGTNQITPYEMTVTDQDTGKTFDVLVKASDDIQARDNAIDQVATKYKLAKNRLLSAPNK